MEPVARELLGEPNQRLSSKRELRFGTHGSMSVDLEKGVWQDHEAGEGGGVLDLIKRQIGLEGSAAFRWMEERHLTNGETRHEPPKRGTLGRITNTYDYTDESGQFLSQVCRFEPKNFRQRRKGTDGEWDWNVKGVRQVPYHLPELIEAIALDHIVFVVEGEKDVENLKRIGVTATCNIGGAGKWRTAYNQWFIDANVVVVADNDPQTKSPDGKLLFHPDGRPKRPGQDHAKQVATELLTVAKNVRYLDMRVLWDQCPEKGDITDWIVDDSGNAEKLYAYVDKLPPFDPQQADDGPLEIKIDAITVLRRQEDIPPRRWLYARHYLRGAVTATVGDPGIGKSNLAIAEGIAMATGRNLLNVLVTEKLKVLYLSGEEPLEEVERRVHAICDFYRIPTIELYRFYFATMLSDPLKLARAHHINIVFDAPRWTALDKLVNDLHVDVIIIDPLVSFHGLPEGDNNLMDELCKRIGKLAYDRKISIDILHHARKRYQNADIEIQDTRGAGAVIGAVRSARVLNRMKEGEATKAGVTEHKRYFRCDNGKANYAPPAEHSTWFGMASVTLANNDDVGVVTSFTFPGPLSRITAEQFDYIKKNCTGTLKYRADTQSQDWVGRMVAEVCDLDADDKEDRTLINRALRTWLKSGALFKVEAMDQYRKKRTFIVGEKMDNQNDIKNKEDTNGLL